MPVANPTPTRLARVVDTRVGRLAGLGRPGAEEVFVAAAEDVEGLSADELSSRLGIGAAPSFYLITFPVESIRGALASPVRRPDQCFVGGGRTRGGAREFVIRNQPIPPFATIEEVF